jgi:hypothetical protein
MKVPEDPNIAEPKMPVIREELDQEEDDVKDENDVTQQE